LLSFPPLRGGTGRASGQGGAVATSGGGSTSTRAPPRPKASAWLGKAARPEDLSDARRLLRATPAGTKVAFSLRRGGEARTITVTLKNLI